MALVSIDASSRKTGMALFKRGKLSDHVLIDLSKDKSDTFDRINTMMQCIINRLKTWKPVTVVIEEPKGHNNPELMHILCEILGGVRGWCVMSGAEYSELKPSVWRKLVGIEQGKKKRDELKAASIALVKDRYDIEVNDDVADAICIGIATIESGNE